MTKPKGRISNWASRMALKIRIAGMDPVALIVGGSLSIPGVTFTWYMFVLLEESFLSLFGKDAILTFVLLLFHFAIYFIYFFAIYSVTLWTRKRNERGRK